MCFCRSCFFCDCMCLGNQGGNEINRQADQWMLTLEGPKGSKQYNYWHTKSILDTDYEQLSYPSHFLLSVCRALGLKICALNPRISSRGKRRGTMGGTGGERERERENL